MDQKIQTIIVSIVGVLAAVWFVGELLSGSTAAVVRGIVFVSVAVAITVLIVNRKAWPGFMVGSLALSISLPVPLLDRFAIASLLTGLMVGITLITDSVKKSIQSVFDRWENKCLLIAGGIVFCRLALDRPGSSRFGDIGGAGEGITYAMAFVGFWVSSRMASERFNAKQSNNMVLALACVGTLWWFVQLVITDTDTFWKGLFENPVWLLSSLLFGLAFSRSRSTEGLHWLVPALFCMVLAMSMVSVFRSRLILAVGIALGVAFVYGRFFRTLIAATVIGVAAIGVLWLVKGPELPDAVRRPLSTLVAVDERAAQRLARDTGSSPEVGWRSEFRATLYSIAWEHIKRRPLHGKGFAFSSEDFRIIAPFVSKDVSAQQLYCTLTGGYHNSVLALIVLCGIPAGLLFVSGFSVILVRFFRQARNAGDRHLRVFAGTVGGYLVARCGQMLANGGANEMFMVCVLLGIMNGLLRNEQFLIVKTSKDKTEN